MWDSIKRFASDRLDDLKEAGGKVSNEVQWAANQLTGANKPQRSKREQLIKDVTGVDSNIIDPSKEPSLVKTVAPIVSPEWGESHYANPLNNTIAINGYEPGKQPYLEAHEAGHLSWEEASPAKFLGVSGRAVTGVSDQIGNPPMLEAIGGALLHFDASEEDRAERFSAKYGPQLGGIPEHGPRIDDEGRSDYGNMLRTEGRFRIGKAFDPITKPLISAVKSANQWNTQRSQQELQPQIRNEVLNYKQLFSQSDDITPELRQSSLRLKELREKYGDGFDDFVGTIK